MRTLGLQAVPSSPTLRQRLDTLELNRSTHGDHIELQSTCNTTRRVNRTYHSFTQSVPPNCRAFCFSTTETLMKYFWNLCRISVKCKMLLNKKTLAWLNHRRFPL